MIDVCRELNSNIFFFECGGESRASFHHIHIARSKWIFVTWSPTPQPHWFKMMEMRASKSHPILVSGLFEAKWNCCTIFHLHNVNMPRRSPFLTSLCTLLSWKHYSKAKQKPKSLREKSNENTFWFNCFSNVVLFKSQHSAFEFDGGRWLFLQYFFFSFCFYKIKKTKVHISLMFPLMSFCGIHLNSWWEKHLQMKKEREN